MNSVDGENLLELDAKMASVDAICQDTPTTSGQSYALSFSLRSRTANVAADTVIVEWFGEILGSFTASAANTWTVVSVNVLGSGNDRLLFRESAGENIGMSTL